MPATQTTAHAANEARRASNAPEGGCPVRPGPFSVKRFPNVVPREEARRTRFSLETTVHEVLLEHHGSLKEWKLNEFLFYVGGSGTLEVHEDASVEEFVANPEGFIHDEELLRRVGGNVVFQYFKGEYILRQEGVHTLKQWIAFENKDVVPPGAQKMLNVAWENLREVVVMTGPHVIGGFYGAVYNARWSHVVEAPGGGGMEMEVKEGRPAQWWEFEVDGATVRLDDAVEQFCAPRPRLMVLTSSRGWPFSWFRSDFLPDCYVNSEVERVWQIVKGDLTDWLVTHGGDCFEPVARALIGTPGIGMSANAGSYLLYQLLHYDARLLPVVVYFVAERIFIFEKATNAVVRFENLFQAQDVVTELAASMRGYIIYDVASRGGAPAKKLPPTGWGMTLLTSPQGVNFTEWEAEMNAKRIIMNCPDESDVRAMCAWQKREEPAQEQAEYWNKIWSCIECLGPVPLRLFNEKNHGMYFDMMDTGVEEILPFMGGYYVGPDNGILWNRSSSFQRLSKVVRVLGDTGAESFFNAPISSVARGQIFALLGRIMKWPIGLRMALIPSYILSPKALEEYGALIFMYGKFVQRMHDRLSELRPPRGGREPRPCVLQVDPQLFPIDSAALLPKLFHPAKIDARYRVLYVPGIRDFPLLDGFFFVEAPRKTLIGLQTTTAKAHHIATDALRRFNEQLAERFSDWETFAVDLSWEIIYVKHVESQTVYTWQRCGASDDHNVLQREEEDGEERVADSWDEKVRQYLLEVSEGDLIAACGKEEPSIVPGNTRLNFL
ncbi:retrotransposon hot spot (RHS) protein [Trypanosoma conorhini]|uniref:Retrotransposon hot spot (RHS) protein n=1 Tax=Trypanosoma conorhini TaxID=83891 RepID=A0A3R7KVL6_9TRYP|nr:retrotransposon hot spot (RHS) protein [Trypanosoma conorhini]RNF02262.1 retrotransposon hot spot (RHS) protein [Trypanosoma conorhini]